MLTLTDVQSLLRERISAVITTYDAHDPGLQYPSPVGRQPAGEPTYLCPAKCGFQGSESEWEQHLADKLAEVLE